MSIYGLKRLGVVASSVVLLVATVMPAVATTTVTPGDALTTSTRLYVPAPQKGVLPQITSLLKAHDGKDAYLIGKMVTTPQAVWITGGTPAEVQKNVSKTVRLANSLGTVPVLVAYNIPYRDCAQYSAGGAVDTAAYKAWIDGFAKGIGNGKAVVLLEPDSLGIIPYYDQFGSEDGSDALEWCQPKVDGNPAPEADPEHRFAQLNYAVDALEALPRTDVYLDGTHSNWLGAGDAAQRLVLGGVNKSEGFYLNVSNFQANDHLVKYGTWISKCIWFGSNPGSWGAGHYYWCASQYYPASPSDFSTWGLSDQWYVNNVESQTWVPYPGDAGLTHFVIDTGRNGQGPWTPSVSYSDPQDWCNPPDRGLGLRPTANTGVSLVDAYLWVKIPGASDGSCTRGTPGPEDPEWGIVDPAAGVWFPQMALDLVQLANPPIPIPKWVR